MKHIDILAKFLGMFPMYQEQIRNWAPKGKNCIAVTLNTNQTLIFLYDNKQTWDLRTQGACSYYGSIQ